MACDVSESSCGAESEKFLLETKRDIPRINGSSSAFIAIVVCLVFIIIAAWVAILFLFRNQRAFDIEQARHSKRDQSRTTPHFSNTATRSAWGSRFMTFFGRVSRKINFNVRNKGGKNQGWVQAGSTDNWETNTGMGVPGPSSASTGPSLQNAHSPHSMPTISWNTLGSLSNVHLDPHGVHSLSSPQMILPPSFLPSIESQLSSSSSHSSPRSINIYLPTLSSETTHSNVRIDADGREYVGSSGMIMRTLQGGTKFVEGL